MKAQIIATLFSAVAVATAVPAPVSGVKTVEVSGSQLNSALLKHGQTAAFDVNQVINCTVSYTLALSKWNLNLLSVYVYKWIANFYRHRRPALHH